MSMQTTGDNSSGEPMLASVRFVQQGSNRLGGRDLIHRLATPIAITRSRPALQQIADVMQHHPDWILTIEGHTDSIRGAQYNKDLSDRRAAAVKTELTGKYSIPAARLQTAGFGLSHPVDKNTTIEGRAKNRRVELTRACGK